MNLHYALGQQITFRVPYFENFLYFDGVIVLQKNNSLSVKYEMCHEDGAVFKYIAHVTEIPLSFIVN